MHSVNLASFGLPLPVRKVQTFRTYSESILGGIQQLRGQEGGEGGLAKIPRLSTHGGGGLLMSTWTKIGKKSIEQLWQTTMKYFIISPFTQL